MDVRVHVHQGLGPRVGTLRNATVDGRSWLRNDAGAAKVTIPMGDAQHSADCIGSEYLYVIESNTGLPPWVGYLPGAWREDGAVCTLMLRELPFLLASRFTGVDSYALGAGAILREVMAAANLDVPHPFRLGEFRDVGIYQSKQYRNTAILQVAQDLANSAGYMWWCEYAVDESGILPTMHWAPSRGRRVSDETLLQVGRNISEWPVLEDRTGLPVGDVVAVGATSAGIGYSERSRYRKVQKATGKRKWVAKVNPATGRTYWQTKAVTRTQWVQVQKITIDEWTPDARSLQERATVEIDAEPPIAFRLLCTEQALWPLLEIGATARLQLPPPYGLGAGLDTEIVVTGLQPDEYEGVLDLTAEVAPGAPNRWPLPAASAAMRARWRAGKVDLLGGNDVLERIKETERRVAAVERRG